MGAGDGPHVFLMDFTLTPEQELIRASARELCERELVPHARALGRGRGAASLTRRDARRGGLPRRRLAGGARGRRARLGLVLPALRGARPRRLVGARDRLGLERALRQDGREVGERGAEAGAAAPAGKRRGARLLRAHRARLRLRRGCARDPSRTRRRRVGADGLEGLHHARLVGRRRRSSSRERAGRGRRGSAPSSSRRQPPASKRGR